MIQVTSFAAHDEFNEWLIKRPNDDVDKGQDVQLLRNGDLLRLEHVRCVCCSNLIFSLYDAIIRSKLSHVSESNEYVLMNRNRTVSCPQKQLINFQYSITASNV